MCQKHEQKEKYEHHNCGCLNEEEIKCCCLEKENSEENSEHIKKCVELLRKKADYMESKIKK
ncbi:MAG: hypothetical protein SVM86_07625 [Candidatus Cloacimonadota bacterium]|nr:hypothetical protein [Candidatus Cloacimonadota bacterium]